MSFLQVLKKQFATNINNQGIRKKKIFTKSIKIGETKPITQEQIFENRFKLDKIIGEIVSLKIDDKSLPKESFSDNKSLCQNPINNLINFNESFFEDINETYDKLYESIYDENFNLIKAIHQSKRFSLRIDDLAEFKNNLESNKNEDLCGRNKSEKIMNMKNKKYFKTNRNKKSYDIENEEILEKSII